MAANKVPSISIYKIKIKIFYYKYDSAANKPNCESKLKICSAYLERFNQLSTEEPLLLEWKHSITHRNEVIKLTI